MIVKKSGWIFLMLLYTNLGYGQEVREEFIDNTGLYKKWDILRGQGEHWEMVSTQPTAEMAIYFYQSWNEWKESGKPWGDYNQYERDIMEKFKTFKTAGLKSPFFEDRKAAVVLVKDGVVLQVVIKDFDEDSLDGFGQLVNSIWGYGGLNDRRYYINNKWSSDMWPENFTIEILEKVDEKGTKFWEYSFDVRGDFPEIYNDWPGKQF